MDRNNNRGIARRRSSISSPERAISLPNAQFNFIKQGFITKVTFISKKSFKRHKRWFALTAEFLVDYKSKPINLDKELPLAIHTLKGAVLEEEEKVHVLEKKRSSEIEDGDSIEIDDADCLSPTGSGEFTGKQMA
jgi:hypothetical protein